ncbi:hypothetical protein Holit_01108 [Hollandina sp. SP2]
MPNAVYFFCCGHRFFLNVTQCSPLVYMLSGNVKVTVRFILPVGDDGLWFFFFQGIILHK